MEYRITHIIDPVDKPHMRKLETSVASDLPEGAISLAELEAAERRRAAEARRWQDGTAIGVLFGRERERVADTSFSALTRGLPSGSVVLEEA